MTDHLTPVRDGDVCSVVDCARPRATRDLARTLLCAQHYEARRAWPLPLIEPTGDPQWRQRANCLHLGPDPFYPEPVQGQPEIPDPQVVETCAACPVRGDCLAAALSEPYSADCGFWGGTSRAHRRTMPRRPAEPEPGFACGDRQGEEAGYTRHRRAGEQPCAACRDANTRAAAIRAESAPSMKRSA